MSLLLFFRSSEVRSVRIAWDCDFPFRPFQREKLFALEGYDFLGHRFCVRG